MSRVLLVAFALGAAALAVAADQSDEIAKYRQLLADGNPAELWEMRGEELWKAKAGPNQVSLERCDLGQGPGVLKGAYAALPRYFKDTGKVMDLEQRLIHCRVTLQGLGEDEARAVPFSAPGKESDIERLVAYITAQSRGMKMAVPMSHPEEKRAYEIGRQLFFYRGGSHDFACATCHSGDGQRIRMQDLPNLTRKADAQAALPGADVRVGSDHRGDDVPGEERRRRRVQRPRAETIRRER
jgi:sulfur-oxidizing protein SoxA